MFEELKENEVMCSACDGVFHYDETKVVDENISSFTVLSV